MHTCTYAITQMHATRTHAYINTRNPLLPDRPLRNISGFSVLSAFSTLLENTETAENYEIHQILWVLLAPTEKKDKTQLAVEQ